MEPTCRSRDVGRCLRVTVLRPFAGAFGVEKGKEYAVRAEELKGKKRLLMERRSKECSSFLFLIVRHFVHCVWASVGTTTVASPDGRRVSFPKRLGGVIHSR